jgi:hypothetical protein
MKELLAIALGDPHFIGTLRVVEIAFTEIPSLHPLSNIHNLIELSLLHTRL